MVEHEPDTLLGEKVGVPAVSEESGGPEASLELSLGVAITDLAVVSVLIFGGLIVCGRSAFAHCGLQSRTSYAIAVHR